MNDLIVVPGKVFDVIGVDEAFIARINEQCMSLKINGIQDKEGYKKVHDARMIYKTTRVKVDKHGKSLRDAVIVYNRDVIKEEKRLIALLEPGESHLAAEEKTIDDALEAIRLEKVRQEELRIQGRIDRLEAFGMGLIAGHYRLPFDAPGVAVPAPLVKICTDEQFEQFLIPIQVAKTKENHRLFEIEQKWIAEQDRIAQVATEQEAERQRLTAVAIEQEKAAREVARLEQERLTTIAEEERKATMRLRLEEAERQKAEDALRAERDRTRREQEEWESIKVAELRSIEAAKQKAIDDENARKQKIIDDERRAVELEKARQEAALKAIKDMEEKSKREAEEKVAKELAAKIREERRLARQPDKAKIFLVADTLENIQTPDVKTDEGKAVALSIMMDIQALIKSIRQKASEL